jgi:ribosomal protein L37AE/L43A
MEDYPRTVEEFERRFSTPGACRAYIEALRWPGGFRCPSCQGEVAVAVRDGVYQCRSCRRQTSATAGTIFRTLENRW